LSVERKEIKLKFGDAIRTRNPRAAVRSHRQPAQIILLVATQTINLLLVFKFADYYNPFVFFFCRKHQPQFFMPDYAATHLTFTRMM
jgi:hypothetical protein